ncbi:hypothetical protein N0V86_000474 [Didymella sp. IMI 355093]|nr:hypothetical protein N0V86_000474 [Didymella sp. IMI 355093]
MGVLPEVAMFRRFGAPDARNLLYMQGDSHRLEKELEEAEADDAKSKEGEKRLYARNGCWITADAENRNDDARQYDLIKKMRELLKEYDHALTQRFTILRHTKDPHSFDLRDIQSFLGSEKMIATNDNEKRAIVFIGPGRAR